MSLFLNLRQNTVLSAYFPGTYLPHKPLDILWLCPHAQLYSPERLDLYCPMLSGLCEAKPSATNVLSARLKLLPSFPSWPVPPVRISFGVHASTTLSRNIALNQVR